VTILVVDRADHAAERLRLRLHEQENTARERDGA